MLMTFGYRVLTTVFGSLKEEVSYTRSVQEILEQIDRIINVSALASQLRFQLNDLEISADVKDFESRFILNQSYFVQPLYRFMK